MCVCLTPVLCSYSLFFFHPLAFLFLCGNGTAEIIKVSSRPGEQQTSGAWEKLCWRMIWSFIILLTNTTNNYQWQLLPIMLLYDVVSFDSSSLTSQSVYPQKHLWPLALMLWKVKVIISVMGASQQLTAHRLFTHWLMTENSGLYWRKLIQIKFQHSFHNVKLNFFLSKK